MKRIKEFYKRTSESINRSLLVVLFLIVVPIMLGVDGYFLAPAIGYPATLMRVVIAICVCSFFAALGLNSAVRIPAYHFGVLERFGERTRRIMYEGLDLRIPFIDSVELVSMELTTTVIGGRLPGQFEGDEPGIQFTTKDKVHLKCEGSLQYRPDPKVKDKSKRNVFITMSDETINEGIKDTIESKISALGGVYNSDDFISNRHAIGDFIDASLRLKTMPHTIHDPSVPNKCGEKDCKLPAAPIPPEQILGFYGTHWKLVKEQLDSEKDKLDERSAIEQRYGIDIETFVLAGVSFTKETQAALEKDRQAIARQGAFDKKLIMAKETQIVLGASAQVALNAADVSLDPSIRKDVVSVEGEAGVLGGLLSTLASGGKKGG